MIALIESAFGISTLWARVAATGGLVALVLGLWAGFAYHYESKGAARVLEKIEQRTSENVQKASEARKAVQSIPDSQLDDRYRRD